MTAKFSETFCSQCGGSFGPGDSGYSHCEDHRRPDGTCGQATEDDTIMKPGSRYTIGKQPCQNLQRGDADIAALGPGNGRNVHQCPICEGNRTWCKNCNTDHHDGGWETCKPGAYATVIAKTTGAQRNDHVAEPFRSIINAFSRGIR